MENVLALVARYCFFRVCPNVKNVHNTHAQHPQNEELLARPGKVFIKEISLL